MQQLKLFDYRRDYLFKKDNQIAHYFDLLSETKETISYSEHIEPKKGFSICGMDYEEYIDVKKSDLNGLTYDEIHNYLLNFNKEQRIEKYKKLLEFRGIKFEYDLFTWNSDS